MADAGYLQSDFVSPIRIYNEQLLTQAKGMALSEDMARSGYLQVPQDLQVKFASIAEEQVASDASDFEKAVALDEYRKAS